MRNRKYSARRRVTASPMLKGPRFAVFRRTASWRLAKECQKLDPVFEMAMAEEGLRGARIPEW